MMEWDQTISLGFGTGWDVYHQDWVEYWVDEWVGLGCIPGIDWAWIGLFCLQTKINLCALFWLMFYRKVNTIAFVIVFGFGSLTV